MSNAVDPDRDGLIGLWVALAIALDGLIALASGLVPDRWLGRYRGPMLGFATGTLLASGLCEILPEAVARDGISAVPLIAAAMLTLGLVEWASARRGHHRNRPILPVALLGSDALHNLGDGMAIAAAFLVGPRLGVLTTAAVMLHELPEEIADYALLRAHGMRKRAALLALTAVQLTAGLGAAGTLLATSALAHAQGAVLAIACGMFVYIAAIDLLPELWRSRSWPALASGALGVAIILVLS
jgi:zinc and cadmium transporter